MPLVVVVSEVCWSVFFSKKNMFSLPDVFFDTVFVEYKTEAVVFARDFGLCFILKKNSATGPRFIIADAGWPSCFGFAAIGLASLSES